MRFEGRLSKWDDKRGFGFITPSNGGDEVFVHVSAFASKRPTPQLNEFLSFEVELNAQGKKRAVVVERARRAAASIGYGQSKQKAQISAIIWVVPIFFVLLVGAILLWRLPAYLLLAYMLLSLFTFCVYALDKSKATRNEWRVPEANLHLFALLGGWPGALLAQQIIRHKSSKAEFQSIFWATVVLNLIGLVLLATPAGAGLLGALSR